MIQVVEIVAPLFALIAIGWLFAKRGWISEAGVAGLMTFLVNLAIPALLFSAVSHAVRSGGLDAALAVAYFLAAFLNLAIAAAVARFVFRSRADESVIAGFSATFGNLALLGVPVISRAYGDTGLAVISLILTFHAPVLMGSATAAVEMMHARGEGPWRAVVKMARQISRNPIVIGVVSGALWGVTGYELPVMLADFLSLLTQAAAPGALFAVGATLVGFSIRGDLRQTVALSAMKMLLLPLLVAGLALWIADPSPLAFAAVVTAAAMPTGVNAFLLANIFSIYERRASGVVFLSTLVCAVTTTGLIAWFLATAKAA